MILLDISSQVLHHTVDMFVTRKGYVQLHFKSLPLPKLLGGRGGRLFVLVHVLYVMFNYVFLHFYIHFYAFLFYVSIELHRATTSAQLFIVIISNVKSGTLFCYIGGRMLQFFQSEDQLTILDLTICFTHSHHPNRFYVFTKHVVVWLGDGWLNQLTAKGI